MLKLYRDMTRHWMNPKGQGMYSQNLHSKDLHWKRIFFFWKNYPSTTRVFNDIHVLI